MKANLKNNKTEIKTVWAGIYGGHYCGIMFFKSKPHKIDGRFDDPDNNNLVLGCMELNMFRFLYPDCKIPDTKTVDVTKLYKIDIEAVFDEYGDFISRDYHFDGY